MIAIVDYKAGNLTSVARALNHLGFECQITSEIHTIRNADRIVFPGVGSAGQAMKDLRKMGLDRAIRDFYESGKPFLGICLGAQIILEVSEENQTTCLGLIPGRVKRFPLPLRSPAGETLKVPHMGWNRVFMKRTHPLFHGVHPESEFYFVHAFFPAPRDAHATIGTTDYGFAFATVIGKQNLVAVQFHPEKSGPPGLIVLKNFCCWDGELHPA
jgi:glutamine amidotransferase